MRLLTILLLLGIMAQAGFAAEAPVRLRVTVGKTSDHKSTLPRKLPIIVELTNTGSADLVLTFNNGQRYDFVLLTEKGEEVTRWSDGRAFVMMLGSMKVAPGETKKFADNLRLEKDGQRLPPGDYLLEAVVTSTPPLKAERVRIHLD